MRRIHFSPPPAALIVGVTAPVAALVGTAVAQPSAKKVTTKKVKKIANQEIDKRLPWTTNDLSDGAVTSGKLASDAVTSGKIAEDAVTSGKINAGDVTTGKLADG